MKLNSKQGAHKGTGEILHREWVKNRRKAVPKERQGIVAFEPPELSNYNHEALQRKVMATIQEMPPWRRGRRTEVT